MNTIATKIFSLTNHIAEIIRVSKFPKAGFPLANFFGNFFARSDLFLRSASILSRLADVIPTKEKGSFARKNPHY
jgi:hypothetical protein